MKFILSVLLFISSISCVYSQETFMYRLYLKDKGNPPYSIENPADFLSGKSIERRIRQGYGIDETDLPIDPDYFEAIRRTGAEIQTCSKWVNTIVIRTNDIEILPELESLHFVDSITCVWKNDLNNKTKEVDTYVRRTFYESNFNQYGSSFAQIKIHNGNMLHDLGFKGEGMTIAVIDGGFHQADLIDLFNQSKILDVRKFNHETSDPLRNGNDHGTKVLSTMLTNKPGVYVGTAPDAEYYLFQSEAVGSEYPVEEDYWVAALEYADSIGADIVTTSLGYAVFDDSSMNHQISDLDGKTTTASKAAGMAYKKGILVFHAAGNEGNKAWGKMMVPADAENILTVGSVSTDSIRSDFSSYGNTKDSRIKPDLMSVGYQTCLVNSNATISFSNGTSYATPVIAGLGACLWQALPDLTNLEIIELLKENASFFHKPDSLMGYGIPNVYKAYCQIKGDINSIDQEINEAIFFTPYDNRLYINTSLESYGKSNLTIYSGLGAQIFQTSDISTSIDISHFPKGVFIVHLQLDNYRVVRKFVKM